MPPSRRLLRGPESPRSNRSSSSASFPATRFVPFEAFPSPIAVPHHCGRYPPAVVVPTSVGACRSTNIQRWFVTPTHAGESCRSSIRWYREACRSLLRGRPEGLPRYRLRTSQAISETATRVSSKESTYAAVCRGYKSVKRALCQTGGLDFPRRLCRCRSPAPTCRCRPGAHCCVFATSRGTVAAPATASIGQNRVLRCHGSDWRGLIRATTEAVPPAPDFAPQGCPCIAPPFPELPSWLPS
jgi:hypothetical protein